MGNAGRNGGEYYTPRPLIRAMLRVVRPEIGERIYDGACGSAGFLCEAFERADSPKSWTVDASDLDPATFDLSVKNPNGNEAVVHRSPRDILDEIAELDAESAEVLGRIRGLV